MNSNRIGRFIIHSGMHKTGSTAIQNALSRCEGEVFHYLRWNGNKNHSIPYLYAFADGGVHARGDIERQKAIRHGSVLREALTRELDLLTSEKVMLSGEAIGAARLGNGVKKLKDFLSLWSDNFDVIMYLRPPRSYSAAEFSQSICSGGTPSVPIKIDYSGISELDRAFGPQSVSLIPYIRSKLVMEDVVLDFCSRVGIPMHKVQSISANASPSLELLSILWEVNRYCRSLPVGPGVEVNEARYKVIRRLAKFGDQKFIMDPAGVRDYNKVLENLNSLSSRVGIDLGACESDIKKTSLCSNGHLQEIALESAPLLVDYVKNMAETERSKEAEIAISAFESRRDLVAARSVIMKMIEIEVKKKG
ncbi:hypothetical protein PAYE108092_17620 [Paracoccus yeei]|uniref:hypothetical protein n=2 Tax=Paracoccus yeei TaxID=147645 RepID=UPI0039F38DA6